MQIWKAALFFSCSFASLAAMWDEPIFRCESMTQDEYLNHIQEAQKMEDARQELLLKKERLENERQENIRQKRLLEREWQEDQELQHYLRERKYL